MDAQAATSVAAPARNLEFAVLQGGDSDTRYLRQIQRACSILLGWYAERSKTDGANVKDTFESSHMRQMLERFLNTANALRMKHAFRSPDGEGRLRVDLTDSGFFNRHEITTLLVDLSSKDSSLRDLPPMDLLKRDILNYLFANKKEPDDLLYKLGLRSYYSMLDQDTMFLPYVPGNIVEWSNTDEKGKRGYVTGWACYGGEKNAPYTYLMHFTQDENRPALLLPAGEADRKQLAEIIREEGSGTLPLAAIGDQIDDQVGPIHPKFFKRTRIGPFYSRLLLEQRPEMDLSGTEKALLDLLRTYGAENDFILFTSEELLFSTSEYQGRRMLLPTKMRQAFYVPSTDTEAYEAGASKIYHYAIMPYSILQNLTQEQAAHMPTLARCVKRIGYDKRERIYEVS
jgi:hypothetical protein